MTDEAQTENTCRHGSRPADEMCPLCEEAADNDGHGESSADGYEDDLPVDDDGFKVRVLWTTDGMMTPIVSVVVPEMADGSEKRAMLDAIADLLYERKDTTDVRVCFETGVEDAVLFKLKTTHFSDVRKNGTPKPPAADHRYLVQVLTRRAARARLAACLEPKRSPSSSKPFPRS